MSVLTTLAIGASAVAVLVGLLYLLYVELHPDKEQHTGLADLDGAAAVNDLRPYAWPTAKILLPVLAVGGVGYGWILLGRAIGAANLLIYTFVFVFMAAVIPASVAFFGPAIPGMLGKPLGTLNWTFAMLAAGVGYLVQRTDGSYDLCWGTFDTVYIDGDRREITGGQANTSRLGWRPFRLVWEKDDGSLKAMRRDADALADGDSAETERAGYDTRAPDSATDEWLVNAVQLVEPLREIAGTALISRAEMQELKKQAKQSTYSNTMTVVGVLVGIVLGTLTGLAMTGAFG